MTVTSQAEGLPVLVSLRCVHRDQESGYVAQLAHGGREGRGDSEEWSAVVAREPRLPTQQLPTREGCRANEGRRVWITACRWW
eukprot:6203171-Pleurochrysis_carterae.AAC.1